MIGGADVLSGVTHVIQVALTPIFLLSAIGTLLNVFSTRLARVADRVDSVSVLIASADARGGADLGRQLAVLKRRSLILDVAVVLAATGGAFTCAAALILFVGALRDSTVAAALFAVFGLAIGCTILAIAAFVSEMLVASGSLRREVEVQSAKSDRLAA